MARILLGWELGAGIGYARRLAAIAGRLAADGHESVLALREPAALPGSVYPVLQAPIVVGRLRPGTRSFVPAGFADLMACNGFSSADHLSLILDGWEEVIGQAQPDLVIAEYAPALALAVWRRIPCVLIGTPYLMPPAGDETFPERAGVRPYADQAVVLEAMREAQGARDGALPQRVTQPFAETTRVPYGLPELDPWSARRREHLHGLWEQATPSPAPADPRIFAYLSPQAGAFGAAVEGLARAGIPGEAHIPDCPDDVVAALAAGGITLARQPPPLAAAIGRASLVFHHGGIDTAQTALALGRPQLLAPRYLDQRLTAEALSALGVGALLPRAGTTAAAVAAQLRRLAGDARLAEEARIRATLIGRRGIGDALAASVAGVRTALGTTARRSNGS